MRKNDREITRFEEIVALVERCDTLRLGIADDQAPYVVPVSFGYEVVDGKIVLYFHGAVAGKKYELLQKNPRICVEGDLSHGYKDNGHGGVTCDYESFIGYGDVELLTGAEADKGIERLMAHCGFPEYACTPEVMAFTAVYRIKADEIAGKRRFLRPER